MKSIDTECKQIDNVDSLLNEILSWPTWKLNASMLDESDLEIRKFI